MEGNKNLICGRKPTFGDKEQIAFIQKQDALFSGRRPIEDFSIDWEEETEDTLETITYSFTCIKCGKFNAFEYTMEDGGLQYEYMQADKDFSERCRCKKCKHKYFYEEMDEQLYFKEYNP
jgi:hypothetical protein